MEPYPWVLFFPIMTKSLQMIPLITWPHSQQSNDMTPNINWNAFMDLENVFIDLKNTCMYWFKLTCMR